MDFINSDAFFNESISARDEVISKTTRYKSSSIIIGKIIKANATIPNTATDELSILIQPVTVEIASLTAVPTIGTVVPTKNFVVFKANESDEPLTKVWTPKIPNNMVVISDNIHIETRFIARLTEDVSISFNNELPTDKLNCVLIKGNTNNELIYDTASDEKSIIDEYPAADKDFPLKINTPAKIGTKDSINILTDLITEPHVTTVEAAGITAAATIPNVTTKFIDLFFSKSPPKAELKSNIAKIEHPAIIGLFPFDLKKEKILSKTFSGLNLFKNSPSKFKMSYSSNSSFTSFGSASVKLSAPEISKYLLYTSSFEISVALQLVM